MQKLSDMQSRILDYICIFSRENTRSPSLRETAEFFGIARSSAQSHIAALIKKGFIRRGFYSRDIIVLEREQSFDAVSQPPVCAVIHPGEVVECTEIPETLCCDRSRVLVFVMNDDFMHRIGIRKYDYLAVSAKELPVTGDLVIISCGGKFFLRIYSAVRNHTEKEPGENIFLYNPQDCPESGLVGTVTLAERYFF